MKKLLSLLFALLLVAGLNTFAFATDSDTATYSGLLPRDPNDALTAQSLTEEQLAFQAEKQAFFNSLGDTPLGLSSSSEPTRAWKYLSGGFTVYQQIKENYCGPAVVYNTLYKLNGRHPDNQEQIATSLGTNTTGTTLIKMVYYINPRIRTRIYALQYGGTKTTMVNYLYSGLCYEMPPMIGVRCSKQAGWKYNASGHALNINGCTTDGVTFNLADPLIGYLGLSGAFYNKSATALYSAYNLIDAGLAW